LRGLWFGGVTVSSDLGVVLMSSGFKKWSFGSATGESFAVWGWLNGELVGRVVNKDLF